MLENFDIFMLIKRVNSHVTIRTNGFKYMSDKSVLPVLFVGLLN